MRKAFVVWFLALSSATLMACGGGEETSSPAPPPPVVGQITIDVEKEELTVPAVGGSYMLAVTCNGTSLTATPSYHWVETSVSGLTASKAVLTIKVKENEGSSSRVATIKLTSGSATKTITVSQEAPLKVGTAYYSTSSRGESFSVSVYGGGAWQAIASDGWIKVERENDGTLVVTTTVNDGRQSRNGTVTVESGSQKRTIKVNQESAEITDIATPAGYQLVWHDEFNEGNTLGADWTHEVQRAGWVNHELQTYVDGEAAGKRVTELVDGKLRINCFKSGGTIYSGRVYARVNEGWKYGYFEARIQLPVGKGTWPAYWMMPVNNDWTTNPWPRCGEIDIMEEVGVDANKVSSSIHTQDYNHTKNTQKTHEMDIKTAETEFHVYALEWTENAITTYVDGQVQLAVTKEQLGSDHEQWPFHYAFYPILNLAWGGDWGGYKGVDDTALPVTMKIDYLRVFQKK